MNKYEFFFPNLNEARKRKDIEIKYINFSINDKFYGLGKNLKFYIRTYGCQANIVDSEKISGILKKLDFKQTNNIEEADLIILNTCAVRENAEKKVFGEIGFLKKLKNQKPNLIFAVGGCMMQEENNVKKVLEQFKHVNLVFGTHNIYQLPEMLYKIIKAKKRVIQVISNENNVIEDIPTAYGSKIKAFVNIMDGCDKFCTYCIVPYTRGKIRSRKKEDILNEINLLIKQGYKEVTLLGQNVNAYGLDFNNNYRFINLLEDVAKTNIPRVRFVTSNPWNFDLTIVDTMVKYKNIMPYIHLPIQSGDNEILKKMNRTMDVKDYIKIVEYIRKNIPNCSISTDLIVGFPNETDKQFQNTLKLYETVKFDNAYTFIYSKRNGTPAALFEDKISLKEKEERLTKLNELVQKYAKENNNKWIGKTVKVLVEGTSKTNDKVLFGYSPEWKVVNFTGEAKIGDIVDVKIVSASKFSLNGVKE